jgi:hypothetical protein
MTQTNIVGSYGARGWKIVRLYGVVSPAVCTCWRGKDCPNPGKHPVGERWDLSATSDEDTILSWFEGQAPVNCGLLLGPRSGIVDVELDGDDAKAAWADLNLGEIWTPTYIGSRGPHRLFRWDEGLPPVAVKKIMGIEVRIGNGGAAAQSVLPPSRHSSGVYYNWVEGLSPDDVEPQPLPERLVNLLWNDDGGSGRRLQPTKKSARVMIHEPVREGGRNSELHRFAVSQAAKCMNLDDPLEQQDLLGILRAINITQCKPPLDEDEVISIYRNAIGYIRKTRAQGMDTAEAIAAASQPAPTGKKKPSGKPKKWVSVFTETGLSFAPLVPGSNSGPEWGPGDWRLTLLHSDPKEYRLHVPAWRQFTHNGTGNIALTPDQFRSAAKTAAVVLASTGVIMLDDSPGKWRRIWDGGYKVKEDASNPKSKTRTARGVKAKLLDNVEHEHPGASSLRYVVLASWLYDRLSQAAMPDEDDVPDPTGRAAWRADGTLWFSWSKVWEDIERQHRVMEGERLALKRRLLAAMETKEFGHAEFKHIGGMRKNYVVWSKAEFACLERMAAETGETG